MDDFQEKVKQIKEKVGRTSLYIGRIPEKTKTEFKTYCETEFEGDYGMCIKWLMDFRTGLLTNPNVELSQRIDLIADELVDLRGLIQNLPQKEKEKKRAIVSVSGKTIAEKEEKNE